MDTPTEPDVRHSATETFVQVRWWVDQNGQPDGPHGFAYIALLLSEGRIKPTTLICRVGSQTWRTILSCDELVRVLETQAPGCIPPSLPISPSVVNKSGNFFRRFTNPALPWFANLICLYCIFVAPAWVVFGFLITIGGVNSSADLKPDSPLIGYAVTYDVIIFVVDVSLAIAILFGGLLLTTLQKKGALLIKVGLTLRLCWGVISIVVMVLWSALVALGEQARPVSEEIAAVDVIMMILSSIFLLLLLACVSFEVVALAWLFRNDDRLPLVDRSTFRQEEVVQP